MVATASRKYRGGIEYITQEFVSGYCYDPESPCTPVSLRILLRGEELAIISANQMHPKFQTLNFGNEACGFSYRFDKSRFSFDYNQINVVPVGHTTPLDFIWKRDSNSSVQRDYYGQITPETSKKASIFSDLFIINHIPKTAGTSLRTAIERLFAEEIRLYHYFSVGACSPEIWNWKFAEEPSLTFEDVVRTIVERPIHLLMGHFGHPEGEGFKQFIDTFPAAQSVAFFRNPCHHIISLWLHARKLFGESRSLAEYMELPYTQNFQTKALCGVSLDEVSFVGIVEHYRKSIQRFAAKYGMSLGVEEKNIRQGDKPSAYDKSLYADERAWCRFEELNQQDIELYRRACGRIGNTETTDL